SGDVVHEVLNLFALPRIRALVERHTERDAVGEKRANRQTLRLHGHKASYSLPNGRRLTAYDPTLSLFPRPRPKSSLTTCPMNSRTSSSVERATRSPLRHLVDHRSARAT